MMMEKDASELSKKMNLVGIANLEIERITINNLSVV
jgi:hypothetical protein